MTPEQSSNPSTSLINHVEVLCHVIPLILDQLLVSNTELKQSERLATISMIEQHRALQMKSEMISQQQETSDLLATEIVEYKKKLHELEETNRTLVSKNQMRVTFNAQCIFV